MHGIQRRELLVQGSAALVAIAALRASPAYAFPTQAGEEVVPWLDQPTENPNPDGIKTQLVWEDLDLSLIHI